MAGGKGQRAVLPEPAHAGVHQAGIAAPAFLGAEAEALHHAGTEAFDEHIGTVREAPHHLRPIGMLEVHGHRPPAAGDDVGVHGVRRRRALRRAIDPDDVGTHVAQHQRAERRRTLAAHLDHPQADQRTPPHGLVHQPPPAVPRMSTSTVRSTVRPPLQRSITIIIR